MQVEPWMSEAFQREMEEEAELADKEALQRERELELAVRNGDVASIDRLLSDKPNENDALARSRSLDNFAERKMKRSSLPKHEIVGNFINRFEDRVPSETRGWSSDGRRAMAKLLRTSKADAMDPQHRTVVDVWTSGISQTAMVSELKSRGLKLSQPTISRIIKEAKDQMGIAS